MNKTLTEAARALASDPSQAERLCRQVLAGNPNDLEARVILAEAMKRKGDRAAALAELESVAAGHPELFAPHRMIGLIHLEDGRHNAAAKALRRAADLQPLHHHVWRELGDALGAGGDAQAASKAYTEHATRAVTDPRLVQLSNAMRQGHVAQAKPALEAYVAQYPTDIIALLLLAEAEARVDRPDLAEATLRRILALAPDFSLPGLNLSSLLVGLGRLEEARDLAQALSKREPANLRARAQLANVHDLLGDSDKAIGLYRSILSSNSADPSVLVKLGHALSATNKTPEAVEAFQSAVALAPNFGVARWSLANLKSYQFSDDEIRQMEAQQRRGDLSAEDRVDMGYALGRAYELRGEPAKAFSNYSEAARLYRSTVQYDAAELSSLVSESKAHFSRDFFEAHKGDVEAADPIFVVGLPRAGSTLVEQILASHSAVEGTMELPTMPLIARSLTDPARTSVRENYVMKATTLTSEQMCALGERYLQATRIHRKEGRPFFIDKMPNNFQHAGLIHLLLPRATIIDVRRHPMACGWSCFKQHFGIGQYFTYDLAELGQYYRDYVDLMDHYDTVLPRRIHRVIYEDLVADPESEIRKLLEACALPFEPSVLSFHQNTRAIRTPSAEQVRRPITADGLNDWKAYAEYLAPLRQALGAAFRA